MVFFFFFDPGWNGYQPFIWLEIFLTVLISWKSVCDTVIFKVGSVGWTCPPDLAHIFLSRTLGFHAWIIQSQLGLAWNLEFALS